MTILALMSHMAFGVALFALSALLTWVLMRKVRIIDHPNHRSSHRVPTPRSGGLAIVATVFIGLLTLFLIGGEARLSQGYYIGFLFSALVIAAVSIYDDLHGLGFVAKLSVQTAAAVVLVSSGAGLDAVSLPGIGHVNLGGWGIAVSLVWIVGLTNAFNFMDGLDGLAGGAAVISAAAFGLVAFLEGSSFIYMLSWIAAAASLGFLVWNFPPAKIFMGDSGSQFLGFLFAAMALIAGRYDGAHVPYLVMPLLFFNFIWDTAFTLVRRWKAGEPVAQAHRGHLYQLVNRMGASHARVTLAHYGVFVAQGIGALVFVHVHGGARLWVFAPFVVFQATYTLVVISRARRVGLI